MKFASPAAWAQDRTPAQWAEHHVRVVVLLIALGVLGSYPAGVFVLALLTAPHPPPASTPAIAGSGVVLSMNDAMSVISIQHKGVPQLNLPAGTTAFPAAATVFKHTEVGDLLSFKLSRVGEIYQITSTEPATADDATVPRR